MPSSIPHATNRSRKTYDQCYTHREISSKAWISVSEKPFPLAITLHLCRNCSKLDGSIVSFFIFFDVMAFPILARCTVGLVAGVTLCWTFFKKKSHPPRGRSFTNQISHRNLPRVLFSFFKIKSQSNTSKKTVFLKMKPLNYNPHASLLWPEFPHVSQTAREKIQQMHTGTRFFSPNGASNQSQWRAFIANSILQ